MPPDRSAALCQPCVSAQVASALRVYIEECEEAARFAEQEGRDSDRDWWSSEELAARDILRKAEEV